MVFQKGHKGFNGSKKVPEAHGVVGQTEPTGAVSKSQKYRNILFSDPFKIANAHPDRAYRFVSAKILSQNGGFDPRGWEAITEQNSMGEKLLNSFGKVSSGTELRYGDVVLAFMPKDQADEKKEAIAHLNDATRQSINQLKEQARRGGFEPEIEVSIQKQGYTENYN